jgi:hypothetical protein
MSFAHWAMALLPVASTLTNRSEASEEIPSAVDARRRFC